jgi:hypothetical protein
MRSYIDIITENDNYADPELDALDRAYDREKHIVGLIHFAFDKIGLTISQDSYSVMYDDTTRVVEVTLDDAVNGFPLASLARLNETGLGDDFRIEPAQFSLKVVFTAAEGLEHARAA